MEDHWWSALKTVMTTTMRMMMKDVKIVKVKQGDLEHDISHQQKITLKTMTAAPLPQFSTNCMKPSETSSTVRMPKVFSSTALFFFPPSLSSKIAVSAKEGQMH